MKLLLPVDKGPDILRDRSDCFPFDGDWETEQALLLLEDATEEALWFYYPVGYTCTSRMVRFFCRSSSRHYSRSVQSLQAANEYVGLRVRRSCVGRPCGPGDIEYHG